jgi:MraZ protein
VEDFQPAVFKGTYRYRIDGKGRLPVPTAFRRALGQGGVVLTLLDECLAAYRPPEWQRLEARLRALPAFNKQARALTRLLTSRAADCTLDMQGRILLPPPLRHAAGLEREAVVVGVLDRFELWRPAAWDSFLHDSEKLLDDVSLELGWPAAPADLVTSPPGGPPLAPRPQGKPSR